MLASISSVTEIRETLVAMLNCLLTARPHAELKTILSNQPLLKLQWGLAKLNAKEFWDFGFDGRGYFIGNIVSVVRCSHRILKKNFQQTIQK